MGLENLKYRTATYLAGDWEQDLDVVDKLRYWNDGKKWSLSFNDIHEVTQSRDTSLYCTIKQSLRERMLRCKNFVLIVGEHTNRLQSGACHLCPHSMVFKFEKEIRICKKNHSYDASSYVQYECKQAASMYNEGKLKIIVLYKSARVDKSKCPEVLRNIGVHISVYIYNNGIKYWNYDEIKESIMG